MTIKRDINKLIPPKARGKKRLAPLAGNRSIGASRGIGKQGTGQGATTTYAERSRSYYSTARELRSADGLFVLQWHSLKQMVFDKRTDNFLDYNPDA